MKGKDLKERKPELLMWSVEKVEKLKGIWHCETPKLRARGKGKRQGEGRGGCSNPEIERGF